MTTRRKLLTGFASLLAAPAIVRVSSIMPISVQPLHYRIIPQLVPLSECLKAWPNSEPYYLVMPKRLVSLAQLEYPGMQVFEQQELPDDTSTMD